MAAAMLAGCGGPSPTTVELTASASPQLNRNSDHQPSPTVVKIYDLKSADIFKTAGFDALFYNASGTLGGDMLERHIITMLPGQKLTMKRDAPAGTQFIGVVAGFRAPLGTQWRALTPIEPEDDNPLQLTLAPSAVTLAAASSGGFFFGLF